jgi:hypothetical protein
MTVPSRSATALRSTNVYNTDGTLQSVTDPTLDALNRLYRAQQGNWNGSAIANVIQDERWMDSGGAACDSPFHPKPAAPVGTSRTRPSAC